MLTHYNLISALTVILNDDVFPDREKTIFFNPHALLPHLRTAGHVGGGSENWKQTSASLSFRTEPVPKSYTGLQGLIIVIVSAIALDFLRPKYF